MPGSPAVKISEPFTKPPPRTLSNSSYPDEKRSDLSAVISLSSVGSLFEVVTLFCFLIDEAEAVSSVSSIRVPQLLHSGHLPR